MDREMARKEALAASKTFGQRDKVAGETKKGWFGRDKAVSRDRAADEGQSYDTRTLPGTTGANRYHNETVMDVHSPQGRDGKGFSLDDLKEAMGRGEVGRTSVAPVER